MSGRRHSIGEIIQTAIGLAPFTATAGGTGDNTDEAGPSFDRAANGNPLSCVIDGVFTTNIASSKQVTITVRLQDSADNSTWADYQDSTGLYFASPANAGEQTLVVAGATTNGKSHVKAIYNLAGARQYVRAVIKAVHTASSTDTTAMAASLIFGGELEEPVPQAANA